MKIGVGINRFRLDGLSMVTTGSKFVRPMLGALGLAGGLAAQDVPTSCRHLFSTSAPLTPSGECDLELGGQHAVYRDGSSNSCFPTQLDVGLCSFADLRIQWSGYNRQRDTEGNHAEGFGDAQLGGQLLFVPQDKLGLDLGFAYWHKVPSASVARDIGTGFCDDSTFALLTRTQGCWVVDVNLGANWVGTPEGRVRQGAVSLCLTWLVAPGWNLSWDTYAIEGTRLGPRTKSTILALNHRVSPDLLLDAAVEAGLNPQGPKYVLNAGLVWRMGRFRSP